MHAVSKKLNSRWMIPTTSGSLIVVAFMLQRGSDAATSADMALVAAAVVPGIPIAIKAVTLEASYQAT